MVLLIEGIDRPITDSDLRYIPTSPEKTSFLEGNYDFAAREVFRWYDERVDYIEAKGSPERDGVYDGEIDEYKQAKTDYWDEIKDRDKTVNWHDDPLVDQIWTVASEAADVAIVAGSELKLQGYPPEWVASLWKGDFDKVSLTGNRAKFRDDLKNIRDDLSSIGVDLAEAIIEKNALNEQHYPHFYPWLLIQKLGSKENLDTFARRFRRGVGPIGQSQMHDLMSNPRLGESHLSKSHGSPFGTNGSSPKAIYIRPNGQVEVAHSDSDHTYGGLYAVGAIKWLFDDHEHRFHHDPERADYSYFFAKPDWRNTLNNLLKVDIRELIVPSGSGFRWNGLKALSKYLNLGFEHVGEVDDELRFKQYEIWCNKVKKPIDIFEFQTLVAQTKQLRLNLFHDEVDLQHDHKGIVVAMDEIIVWYDEKTKAYVPIERPKNEEDPATQIRKLVSGEQYFVSNVTIVSTAHKSLGGEGMALQLIPMRINCSDEDRESLYTKWLGLYRDAASKKSSWKVTPGGVSLLHPELQPFQMITLLDDISQMVMPFAGYQDFGRMLSNEDFIKFLLVNGKEREYLKLSEKQQNEVGIAVGGLSLAGLKSALDRFLLTRNWFQNETGGVDPRRMRRLYELREMLKIPINDSL